jgi:glycosyltransferase involved in cell wall biosynthesis
MRLSIIIPAYNEEERIAPTLKEYSDYFTEKMGKDFEVFVAVNGCTDDTIGVIERVMKTHKGIRYVDIGKVAAKGSAIIEAFKLVEGDYIGFVDADNATPPRAFYDLYDKIGNNDGIIASRWIKGAVIGTKQPLARRISSRIFNLLVRGLFGIKLRDSQCGAKLFTKEAAKSVVGKLGITKWAFDIDLLYLLKRQKFRVIEIPTEWNEPGGTKLDLKKTIPEMFLSIFRLRLMYSPFKFIVRIYDKVFGNG